MKINIFSNMSKMLSVSQNFQNYVVISHFSNSNFSLSVCVHKLKQKQKKCESLCVYVSVDEILNFFKKKIKKKIH